MPTKDNYIKSKLDEKYILFELRVSFISKKFKNSFNGKFSPFMW